MGIDRIKRLLKQGFGFVVDLRYRLMQRIHRLLHIVALVLVVIKTLTRLAQFLQSGQIHRAHGLQLLGDAGNLLLQFARVHIGDFLQRRPIGTALLQLFAIALFVHLRLLGIEQLLLQLCAPLRQLLLQLLLLLLQVLALLLQLFQLLLAYAYVLIQGFDLRGQGFKCGL